MNPPSNRISHPRHWSQNTQVSLARAKVDFDFIECMARLGFPMNQSAQDIRQRAQAVMDECRRKNSGGP